jgi:uncharacterized protein YyaL (SSP411 family)
MLPRLRALALVLSLASCAAPPPPIKYPDENAERALTPDWQRPSPSALTRAKAEHRLVLLSVQAEFCHFCHVMNETTYRDAKLVALLRERFVTLRIDQAEDPALSARYADYGWPATAILDAQGEPVLALRGHQPAASFYAVLTKLVADLDAGKPLSAPVESSARAEHALSALERAALARMDALYDAREGGWGTPQKYPFAAPVEYALARAYVHGEEPRRAQALRTLAGHARLIDPVAGGMYQYSLGAVWSAPHHEKLAEIQAGALRTFAQAYRSSHEPGALSALTQVARYVLSELRNQGGSFMASQHADSGALGQPSFMTGAAYYARSEEERAQVTAPAFDRHVYADLNGMLIRGLVEAFRASDERAYLEAAQRAALQIAQSHRRGATYVHEANEQGATRFLRDQVEMAAALSALADATGDERYRIEAYATLDVTMSALYDGEQGGFFAVTAEGAGVFEARNKPLDENAHMARLLVARARREYEPRFMALAESTLQQQASAIQKAGRKAGDALLALADTAGPYVMFSLVGPPNDPRTEALRRAAYRSYAPHALLRSDLPGQGHYPYPGEPVIYLCSESACSAPVSQPEALAASLDAFVRAAREP